MIIHPRDNVEVLLDSRGDDIPSGHKIALCDICKGDEVVKYGFPIGHATRNISKGEWVHTHNLATNLSGTIEYVYKPSFIDAHLENIKSFRTSFNGYLREDGRVGIRNELWILPTVGCVSDLATELAHEMQKRTKLIVRSLSHTFGCSQLGEDHENTCHILAALAEHPNAGGVLVLGLGCENNQIGELKKYINSPRVRFLETQKVENEKEAAILLLSELAHNAELYQRTIQPLSKLSVGLKCGGSDGFSGITANPLLGRFSDWLVRLGGTTVLTEVPEMFGAETILMNRCTDHLVYEDTVSLINNFKQYYLRHNLPIGENPSPGNKEGGITTLEEKSLGCIQKGGTAKISGVLSYSERLKETGLNLLCAPGNDLVASTALAASGCQIVLFTTGRGTPFGTCVPTFKVSTNSDLAHRKSHWIDFDAGVMLDGVAMDDMIEQFITLIVNTIEGKLCLNEKNNCSSIAIWKNGVTL